MKRLFSRLIKRVKFITGTKIQRQYIYICTLVLKKARHYSSLQLKSQVIERVNVSFQYVTETDRFK